MFWPHFITRSPTEEWHHLFYLCIFFFPIFQLYFFFIFPIIIVKHATVMMSDDLLVPYWVQETRDKIEGPWVNEYYFLKQKKIIISCSLFVCFFYKYLTLDITVNEANLLKSNVKHQIFSHNIIYLFTTDCT